jgi:hypothetical protein
MNRLNPLDFMKQAIATDFEVEQVAEDEDWILFAAGRTDFFHLVEYGAAKNRIIQHHIPHLALAVALEKAMGGSLARAQGDVSIASVDGELLLAIRNDAVPFTVLQGGLAQKLRKLPSMLDTARKKAVREGDRYSLPRAKTFSGNPVASESGDLIAGIALEKALRRRLNASHFGLYSAFCTHADFPRALHRASCIEEIIENHAEAYGNNFPDDGRLEIAKQVQDRLFPFPIWAPGIPWDAGRAKKGLQAAVSKLDAVQATQAELLNGMHGGDIFLALAAVTGIVTFEQYKEFQTDGLQPDSEREQFLRISTSFIELFGETASR